MFNNSLDTIVHLYNFKIDIIRELSLSFFLVQYQSLHTLQLDNNNEDPSDEKNDDTLDDRSIIKRI